jgi:subtilisin family serine protease
MATSYYYRGGRRIPVVLAESARAARMTDERAAAGLNGLQTHPLTKRHMLVYSDQVLARDGERSGPLDLPSLSRRIVDHERTTVRDERSGFAALRRGPLEDLLARTDLPTFPVAIEQEGQGVLISTGDVAVQFASNMTREEIESMVEARQWTVARTLPFMENGYLLRATRTDDPFAFANELVERHGARFAHPVFLEDIPERATATGFEAVADASENRGESLVERQWHLRNHAQGGGQEGVDIGATAAWRFTTGNAAITACVIDSGINLDHECFRRPGQLVAGFDFEDHDADPRPTDSNHGTACAALIAADPSRGSVSGVAPGCRLMPIRRPGLTDHVALSEAFAWAADQGADVISCSFGIDGRPWVLPDVARAALVYATEHGRGGKGCPIFWAAGNGSELITNDEWASSPYTIAVAASTDQGRNASYSDFGPEVSICAPSSGGASGIVTAINDGYTGSFGGTSAAAPIAAGVAALLLSLSPNLRWQEVRDLLQRTARHIDSSGSRYDARGHSDAYGYGQIDAGSAMQGIAALQEVERATNTAELDEPIRAFIQFVRGTPGGSAIHQFVGQRRLGLLSAFHANASLTDSIGRILRLMADLGQRLQRAEPPEIPDGIWPAVEVAIPVLKSLAPDSIQADRSERSIETGGKVMPTTRSLDDAFAKLASMLGGPGTQPAASVAASGTSSGAATAASPATSSTWAGSGTTLTMSLAEREEVARNVFYSQSMPLITREKLKQMEAELPALVEQLKSLSSRPAAMAEMQQFIQIARESGSGSDRSSGDQERAAAFGQLVRNDAFGEGERLIPLIALGIASFMASYTVVKNWKT